MINVNQITSQLARLPDPALQKYAQMHKDDPYIMALTMSEFNRRKQTRQGAQMNAPEQPKVVDQAIQSMGAPMPEDVGIAQLPAGDMNFAEGGIVAFSDGGDVPRYQSRGLVQDAARYAASDGESAAEKARRLMRMAQARAAFSKGLPLTYGLTPGMAAAGAGVAAIPAGMAYGLTSAMDEMRAQGYPVDPMGEFGTGAATPEQASFDEDRRQRLLKNRTDKRAAESRLSAAAENRPAPAAPAAVAPGANTPVAPAAGPAAVPGAAPGAGTNRGQRPPSGGPGAAAPSAAQDPLMAQLLQQVSVTPTNFEPSQATMPTAEGIQKLFAASRPNAADVDDPFAEQRQELTNLATLQNAQEQAAFEKQVKERGQLGEKQEARLKAREEKLGKQEKDLGPLAMIQAGFAIMGGQSRSALQNIGLGAQVGFKGYREGLEKLEASRERIEDGLERIETARRSEGVLNDQQRSALRREGNNIVREGKKEGINALTTELGVKRAEANTLVTTGINVLTEKGKIGSAERLGAAQMEAANLREAQQQTGANVRAAAQLSAQERIAAMESAAKRADSATRLAEVKAQLGIKNDADLREIYAKSLILQQRFPDVNEYLKIMKGTGSTAGTDYSKWGTPAKVGP